MGCVKRVLSGPGHIMGCVKGVLCGPLHEEDETSVV